jgi:hypothetical protein
MAKASRTTCLLVLLVVAAGIAASQARKTHLLHEQTLFREDKPLQHPVPVSQDVLRVLLERDEVKQGLDFSSDSERNNPTQLFRAAEVYLSSSDEVGLVVIGIPPMTGADNDWFWVVRSPRHNPSVVLFSGGDYLQLLNSGTNGLRDIRRLFSTASETRETIYKFDGTRYKIAKDKWTEKPQ